MSRKITDLTAAAFAAARPMRSRNTAVALENGFAVVRLHGNAIAARNLETGETRFTLAGWNTPTTRERLHAAGVSVGQRAFEPYFYPLTSHPDYDAAFLVPDHDAAFRIDSCVWYDARTGAEAYRPAID